MANFHLHEDPAYLVENVRPKQVQNPIKGFPAQAKKNRTVLQTLSTQQQNCKQQQTKQQGGARITRAQVKKIDNALSCPSDDLIKLKPVFKKTTIITRLQSNESKEYEEEIWGYLNRLETRKFAIKPYYMPKQPYITWSMRSVLIDWLVSVGEEYTMSEKTLQLSVNYLDRFLSNISVIKEKFQLVGATAMMIAGKIEEIYPPNTKEWSYLTGDAYTVHQLVKMEQLMLKILNFDLNAPTMFDFINHLCYKHKVDSKTMYLAMYLSELVLLEGEDYLQYFPSKLAAASLVLARHTLHKAEPWPEKMVETSGYSLKQLSPVVQKQHKTFKSSPYKEQKAIQKKYATDKYQKVALLKPRILVLDLDEE